MIRALVTYASIFAIALRALFRTRQEQAVIELALRQQLAICIQNQPRPRFTDADRGFWVALRSVWPRWRSALLIVQPETVIRWHRRGFHLYWRSISRPGPGRPRVSAETRQLIVRMATENPWRARRIQAELEKLGIRVSLATVSRYLPKRELDFEQRQRWMTFLRNYRDAIGAMDFLVVPTACFKLLYVWFVIKHDRREILHVNVTAHPTATWVIQQLRETFPDDPSIRFLIHDNDSIFSDRVDRSIANFDISPIRTSPGSPWQNRTAERWVGTVKRDLLDHVIVLDEPHLRRLLCDYVKHYNEDRVHTIIRDSPTGRSMRIRPSPRTSVVGQPRLGRLHHFYEWREAA